MTKGNTKFKIESLDHVAIRVQDINISAEWYQRVLGLVKCKTPRWGAFPVLLLAEKSGIAIFPADLDDPELNPHSKNIRIDHFAFRVTKENFDLAEKRYSELNLDFEFQDHYYFHSIYTKDPDGHTVELTTLVIESGYLYG